MRLRNRNKIYRVFIIMTSLFTIGFGKGEKAAAQDTLSVIESFVMDRDSLPLPNVLVYPESNKSTATITDAAGFFRLSIPKGRQILVFHHTGFASKEVEVTAARAGIQKQGYIFLETAAHALQEVVISGKVLSATSSLRRLQQAHKEIAGGTSIAVMHPEVQRLETVKDALKYEPGIVIQELFGANDQPRLSIRGSGIQSNPQRRGIYLLQDGIPVNFADGSFIIGAMDVSLSESIEVFKGANALQFGSATLGGALNFNSKTGRQTQGVEAKIEGGSFGYASLSAMAGDRWSNKDAFLGISGSRQDGFRQHNENKHSHLTGNFGYKISGLIDNRTYLDLSHLNFDIPGPLTLKMIRENPRQISDGIKLPLYMGPNIKRDRPKREAGLIRIANKTAIRLSENTDLTASIYYQHIDDRFVFPIVLSTERSAGNDFGLNLQAGHRKGKNIWNWGLLSSYGKIDRRGYINKDGQDSFMFSRDNLTAFNLNGYVEYRYAWGRRLQVVGDVQAIYNERNLKDVFPFPDLRPWYSHSSHKYRYFHSENTTLDQSFSAINPRIGAIYNTGKDRNIQFFGNVSTGYEPPTFDELVGTEITNNINTSPKKIFTNKLDKQTAVTLETGSRYEGKRISWNASLYRSWIKNELLEVKDFVLGVKKTENYPESVHQGIELTVYIVALKGVFLDSQQKDQFSLKGMYTYSDFYFRSGVYEGKKIAGMPPHYLTGSLEYRYPNQFFMELNLETQPVKTSVDHTNTFYQPAFALYGFRVGMDRWKHFSFYMEGKNILNKHYASSYIVSDQILLPPIPFPKFTAANMAFFMPGPIRAFYAGITYKF